MKSNLFLHSVLIYLFIFQLYVALLEWHMGERQHIEFTATAFLDIYSGNVDTLQSIKDRSETAYQHVMEDIYMRARCVLSTFAVLC